ncbi:MAG: PLDc N-terminal domain-containing protein [Dehalococcoidia bacterium]
MWKRRRRRALGRRKRFPLAIMGLIQFALLVAAQIDLLRRPDAAVRGPKWAWRAATLVNFVGPLAYFALGRREVAPASSAPAVPSAFEPA